jgi:aspartate racemase
LAKSVSYFGVDGDEVSWLQFDEYHRRALQRLEAGGAEVACVASNTPHHRFENIVKGIGIPVISILDAVASECVRMGLRHVMLLGTALTMNSQTFRSGFSKYGIAATRPVETHVQAAIVELIADLQRNRREGAADRLHRLAASAFGGHPGERPTVCLACTELPLAFEDTERLATFERDGIVYVNANVVHVNAVFHAALGDAERGAS